MLNMSTCEAINSAHSFGIFSLEKMNQLSFERYRWMLKITSLANSSTKSIPYIFCHYTFKFRWPVYI
eukprot:UN14812